MNNPAATTQLTVKTLLRQVQDFCGFAIRQVRQNITAAGPRIDVELAADSRRPPLCSCCKKPGHRHDQTRRREWLFVPLWNIPVYLHYTPRRVVCATHSVVKVEWMPWSQGKSPYSKACMHFLATWAKRLSWSQTATIFHASWDAVRRSVEWMVNWGLDHRDLSGVSAVGIDELHHGRGKTSLNFLTLVYQINRGSRRLLWIGQSRTEATLRKGFDELEKRHNGFLAGLEVVCSDMWKPFLKVVRQRCGQALNVLDPFHVARHLNVAVDSVRRGEQARLVDKESKKRTKGARFLMLKRGTTVRGKAREKLKAVLASLGQTSRAWELKESFRRFWRYKSAAWASAYLHEWTCRAMRSRIEPMKKVARMLRAHQPLLLNYFRAKRQYTNAMVEGMNHKARVSLARSYGHRSFEILKLVLYHTLGELPEPPIPHKFC
jgi:transposase